MRALALSVVLLGAASSQASPVTPQAYLEVRSCRPAEEEGEFLQRCVKLNTGRRAGRVLGPGLVAPGGQAAVVIQHRRYGSSGDRVTLRIYGPDGRPEASYPLVGPEEYPLYWSATGRFLAWVEVDGRGGQLRVLDRQRRRLVLSALSPLEDWPVFAPSGAKLLLPRGEAGEDRVREVELVDLLVKGSRQPALKAGPDEELTQLRWTGAASIQAVRRKVGAAKGKTVQASFQPPRPSSDDAE